MLVKIMFFIFHANVFNYTVKRQRPLARRLFKISRPPFVDIRALNPCVLLRLILLG